MNEPSIRRQVSNIFGVVIGPDEWDEMWERLNKENRLHSKNINKVLLVILKRLEELEK